MEAQITPADEVLECAANLSGLRTYAGIFSGEGAELLKGRAFFRCKEKEFATNSHIDKGIMVRYNNLRIDCKLEAWRMAKYLTRQRKRLLEYLSEHTDEQISARQIARRSGGGSDQHQRCLPQHLRFGGRRTSQTQRAGRDKGSLLPVYCVRRMQRQPAPVLPHLRKEYSFRTAGSDAADSRNIRKHWLSD